MNCCFYAFCLNSKADRFSFRLSEVYVHLMVGGWPPHAAADTPQVILEPFLNIFWGISPCFAFFFFFLEIFFQLNPISRPAFFNTERIERFSWLVFCFALLASRLRLPLFSFACSFFALCCCRITLSFSVSTRSRRRCCSLLQEKAAAAAAALPPRCVSLYLLQQFERPLIQTLRCWSSK